MNFLKGIFENDSIKKMAFSGLRKLMDEEKLTCIVLRNNPEKQDGPIPGFDVDMFKTPIAVFEGDTVGISPEQFEDYKNMAEMRDYIFHRKEMYGHFSNDEFEAMRDPEVRVHIERYLKAKKLADNGRDSTTDAGHPDTTGTDETAF